MKRKSIIKRFLWITLILFCLMNLIAYLHAYKFTHFDKAGVVKTKGASHLSFGQKLKALFAGVNNPRPQANELPNEKFETLKLKSNKTIECWWVPTDAAKGSVILFHGYGGEKSSMLDKAAIFREMGYNTLLVDFMGAGGSEGNQTTIGYYEAAQVKTAFDFLNNKGEKNIILFGTSLGAVAIMKAQKDYHLKPTALLLECAFGSMLKTVQARFASMNVPSLPMADLLVFWGGVQNGFNAFDHNPIDYAEAISIPTLLLYGEKDEKVSRKEIDDIFKNLTGPKKLITYPLAGHENYLNKYRDNWKADISLFLQGEK
ncbi:alpha/beta hydrolase [Terrimonas alba]|uniref:alpha/beta hydrolase n=1 Tax=Terrimonas alba TaxID=3349636 RepID=UPI0035F35716